MKYLLILFLLLPSCHKTPINIYIDPTFSHTQISQIHDSFSFWSNNSSLSLNQNNQSFSISIFYANKGWKKNKFYSLTKSRETPLATTIHNQIFIPPSPYSNSHLFNIISHELGHNFGCYHTNSPNDIMSPFLSLKPQSISKNCTSLIRKTF